MDERIQKIVELLYKNEETLHRLSLESQENSQKLKELLERSQKEGNLFEEISQISKSQHYIQEQLLKLAPESSTSKKVKRIEKMIEKIEETEIQEEIDDLLWSEEMNNY